MNKKLLDKHVHQIFHLGEIHYRCSHISALCGYNKKKFKQMVSSYDKVRYDHSDYLPYDAVLEIVKKYKTPLSTMLLENQ